MDGPAQYLHIGFILISLANLIVIALLVIVFVLAVALRPPEKQRLSTLEARPELEEAGERQRTFTLRLGHQGSCLDPLGQESDSSAITETVRMQYRESLF